MIWLIRFRKSEIITVKKENGYGGYKLWHILRVISFQNMSFQNKQHDLSVKYKYFSPEWNNYRDGYWLFILFLFFVVGVTQESCERSANILYSWVILGCHLGDATFVKILILRFFSFLLPLDWKLFWQIEFLLTHWHARNINAFSVMDSLFKRQGTWFRFVFSLTFRS